MTSLRIASIRIAIAAALAAALFAGGSAHARPASAHGVVLAGATFQAYSPVPCCDYN
jgi:hypothetical protein